MINWVTLVPFIAFVSYLIILISNFENWIKTRQGRIFVITLASLAGYSFSSWLMHHGTAPSPLFWLKVELAAAFLLIPLIPHFAMEFPAYKKEYKWLVFFFYLLTSIVQFLLFSDRLVIDANLISQATGVVEIKFSPLMNFIFLLTSLSLALAIIIYTRAYIREKGRPDRGIIAYPLAGTIIILIGALLNIFPALRSYPLDVFGNFIYSILVAYAILRHQFLNPGAIFRKSSVYFVIALSLNAVILYVLFKFLPLVEDMPGWQFWVLFSPIALLLVILMTPMRQRFQNWIDSIFFGEQYNYRLTMENFSKQAASNLNLKELTNSLVAMLNKVFNCPVALFMAEKEEESLHLAETAGYTTNVPEYSFVLKNSPVVESIVKTGKPFPGLKIKGTAGPAGIMASDLKWLDTVESELVCPLIFKDKLSGIVVLGRKKGLYPYSDEDISLLSALSSQIAIALDNARLYMEAQEAYKGLKDAQEHLMHSERMRLLGEVSSGVAHDLNNHLAVISARAEMNLALIDNPQAYRNTELILKAADDSANVVKRLREFVKKPKDILQDQLDVNKVITELLPMLEHRRSEIEQTRGVFFEIDYKLQANSQIMGNSSELRQAMVNILFNAFDAMPNGGRIEVEARDKDEWVLISLRDNGVGMTPEVKEKIFKPFFTTKGEKGSGLGLSIALGIVNKHGGKLTFESEVGKGTAFYLTFPAVNKAASTGKDEIKGPASNGNSKRILVIEDNRELGEAITFFLNDAGYKAMLATEGTDGLAKFQQDSFNMVVTDWGLSPMTGGDVALSIKAMDSEVPILVITGWELNLSPVTLKDMGIVDVIIKPFSREEFLVRIARITAKS